MPDLAKRIPAKHYPSSVTITETIEGKPVVLRFLLQSYLVGMYCAMYIDGKLACQRGDHNNRTFLRKLLKDVKAAEGRGATVEMGDIQPIQGDDIR